MRIIGIASGFFNPLHVGHLDYLEEARRNCDFLIVFVNTDEQVKMKGSVPFMKLVDRMRIVQALECVDMALASISIDDTVCHDIYSVFEIFDKGDEKFKFFNSGDRTAENTPEYDTCKELGVELVIFDQPKVESSSNLLNNISES